MDLDQQREVNLCWTPTALTVWTTLQGHIWKFLRPLNASGLSFGLDFSVVVVVVRLRRVYVGNWIVERIARWLIEVRFNRLAHRGLVWIGVCLRRGLGFTIGASTGEIMWVESCYTTVSD